MSLTCCYDSGGGTHFGEQFPTARKEHSCCECRRTINPGTDYVRSAGVYDGDFYADKYCETCWGIVSALTSVGFCYAVGDLRNAYAEYLEGYVPHLSWPKWGQPDVTLDDYVLHNGRTITEQVNKVFGELHET